MDRIALLKDYLRKSPEDAFLNHALALEYVKLGQDPEAITHFERVLNNNPDYIGSYYHLAKALERRGARDKAITIYEQGLQVAGRLQDAHARGELQAAYDDLLY